MKNLVWVLAGVMLFAAGAYSEPGYRRPAPGVPLTETERDAVATTAKLRQIETQLTQIQAMLSLMASEAKVADSRVAYIYSFVKAVCDEKPGGGTYIPEGQDLYRHVVAMGGCKK